ncbi:ThuA domain-containing protein [Shewanella sp. 10N.286.48.B5]|uniref:ThuA domain-containing protein n=1 Tax=Shewanella sp. 10N.286.48.B5 TaxID=1880834 RepID=UPI000C834712|nr:ThuA domain-containing protein [Shewanella sp. 10N.286.48.B5]PMH84276.1 trehalose utilization [Shewanella sp. 10N.286.48.B5]
MNKTTSIVTLMMCVSCASSNATASAITETNKSKLNALILDGQNNHTVWPKSTVMMKQYLEDSDLFTVDVYRTKPTWKGESESQYYDLHSDNSQFHVSTPEKDLSFNPNFSNYDVVISNLGFKAASWSKGTQDAFETYMENGGGFVSVHAADNTFPQWLAFNKMIGLGGWGGRDESNGPYLYYDEKGKLIRETQKGSGGTHGKQHELQITTRAEHPIVEGLPAVWMHTKDECYGRLRGPAENITILATAHCTKDQKGTGKHEPMLMTVHYGQGRIFHTTLGHGSAAFESVGFITTFLRGVEWSATGKVTQTIPDDFPSKNQSQKRVFTLNQD